MFQNDSMTYYVESLEEYIMKKAEDKKKTTSTLPKKQGGLFTDLEKQAEQLSTAEEIERKKAVAKQDKHLLEEASSA